MLYDGEPSGASSEAPEADMTLRLFDFDGVLQPPPYLFGAMRVMSEKIKQRVVFDGCLNATQGRVTRCAANHQRD